MYEVGWTPSNQYKVPVINMHLYAIISLTKGHYLLCHWGHNRLCIYQVFQYSQVELTTHHSKTCLFSFNALYIIEGDLLLGISLVLMEYKTGYHNLARDPILVTEKVGYHLTKCMDYHQLKWL